MLQLRPKWGGPSKVSDPVWGDQNETFARVRAGPETDQGGVPGREAARVRARPGDRAEVGSAARAFLPLDVGTPAGGLGAVDSMVRAGPGGGRTSPGGGGLGPGGVRSWLQAGGRPGRRAGRQQGRVRGRRRGQTGQCGRAPAGLRRRRPRPANPLALQSPGPAPAYQTPSGACPSNSSLTLHWLGARLLPQTIKPAPHRETRQAPPLGARAGPSRCRSGNQPSPLPGPPRVRRLQCPETVGTPGPPSCGPGSGKVGAAGVKVRPPPGGVEITSRFDYFLARLTWASRVTPEPVSASPPPGAAERKGPRLPQTLRRCLLTIHSGRTSPLSCSHVEPGGFQEPLTNLALGPGH